MDNSFSKDEFSRKLRERCPDPQPCPFCGEKHFGIVDKMANISIQNSLSGFEFGRSIPCGIAICSNCGHVNFFALGFLGMITNDGGGANGQKK